MTLPSLEAQLTQVRALKTLAPVDLLDTDIRRLLSSKHALVAAPAAALIARTGRTSLIPFLIDAFDRFSVNGEKTDKGCLVKLAVINALCALDHRDGEIYLRAVRMRQM